MIPFVSPLNRGATVFGMSFSPDSYGTTSRTCFVWSAFPSSEAWDVRPRRHLQGASARFLSFPHLSPSPSSARRFGRSLLVRPFPFSSRAMPSLWPNLFDTVCLVCFVWCWLFFFFLSSFFSRWFFFFLLCLVFFFSALSFCFWSRASFVLAFPPFPSCQHRGPSLTQSYEVWLFPLPQVVVRPLRGFVFSPQFSFPSLRSLYLLGRKPLCGAASF